MLRFAAFLIPVCVVVVAAPAMAETDADGVKFFEAKVRPVLAAHCYKCHSDQAAKAGKLKGELRLDNRDALRKGGESGVVIVPGKPEESRLIQGIRYTNENFQMPPKDRLSAQIVADLEKWVAMGAPDPRESAPVVAAAPKRVIDLEAGRKYWAFQPLAKVKPPAVNTSVFAKTPIDQFILAKLDQKGIIPNAPASRAVLIRRAYADLIGLPPTPVEVDAFVNDPSPDAWPKLIDHLLASDHYGERWGRHWLDIVRFAESNGYEFDGDRRGAYQYRDFVIRAFNRDMPYDQFIRWQLAGDKILPGSFDASAATGFLVAGPSPGQITAKTAEPIRYDQLDDMISTLGSSMLGLTIGCARCHDHKFDPLPQRDYYRMISCFADMDSTELKIDPKPEIYQRAEAKWKDEHAPLEAAWEKFTREGLAQQLAQWTREGLDAESAPWLVLDMEQGEVAITAKAARGNKARQKDIEKLKNLEDGSLLLQDRARVATTFTLSAETYQKNISALRIEALADKLLPAKGPGIGAKGEFLLTRVEVRATPINGKGKPVDVKLKAIRASSQGKGMELALATGRDARKGWGPDDKAKDATGMFEFEKPIGFDGGTTLTITLRFDTGLPIGRARLAIATAEVKDALALDGDSAPQAKAELKTLLDESKGELTDKNRAEIGRWMRMIDPGTAKAYAPVLQHLDKEPVESFDNIFAAGVKGGRPVYFLGRGETAKKNGLAPPGFVEVLMTAPEQDQRWTVKGDETASAARTPSNKPTTRPVEPRVAMADWITDTTAGGGQLLARALVNRLWMHHMGRGIVATPNDFGVQGDPPTHPELLDFLAHDLISNGWHIKPLQKLIMTSSVYMESCDTPAANVAKDPENKLCWRHPSQRLEAEVVRDTLLAVSGALDETMYGPGSLDESNPRRSVYLTVKRSKPVLMMQLFDAPEAMQSIGQRQVTTVATQALTLMNSPFVRARAEQLAKRVRPTAKIELGTAIEQAYRLTFCRPPTEVEKSRMTDFIERQAKTYTKNGMDSALADFCQVLICSDEFVYVD